jgi:hypothetical protein
MKRDTPPSPDFESSPFAAFVRALARDMADIDREEEEAKKAESTREGREPGDSIAESPGDVPPTARSRSRA